MLRHTWDSAFNERGQNPVTLETKIVLFLYLMCRRCDYGYNISKIFSEATKPKNHNWTNKRGLRDLQYPNKTEAALKRMEEQGILVKYSDLKNQLPDYFFQDEIETDPRRSYYSVNPSVICNVWQIPFETESKTIAIRKSHYTIFWGLRFIQEYQKDDSELIRFINAIPKYDYLSILVTASRIWNSLNQQYLDNLGKEYPSLQKRNTVPPEYRNKLFFNKNERFEKLLNTFIERGIYPDSSSFYGEFYDQFISGINESIVHAVYLERSFF